MRLFLDTKNFAAFRTKRGNQSSNLRRESSRRRNIFLTRSKIGGDSLFYEETIAADFFLSDLFRVLARILSRLKIDVIARVGLGDAVVENVV